MRTVEEWTQRELGRTSALVLGWRRGARIRGGRLNLDRAMDRQLRSRALATLRQIGERTTRSYDPSGQLEDDEIFLLEVADLPDRPVAKSRRNGLSVSVDEAVSEASQLIDLLRAPGHLDPISPEEARGQIFLFYAVVFSGRNTTPIAFVKRHNPGQVLKAGRVFGLFGEVITEIEDPILVFESDFDLVIDGDEIAAMRANALPRLFADLEIASAAVPSHLDELRGSGLSFAEESLTLIAAACAKRRLLAGRLQNLVHANHLPTLTVEKVRQYVVSLDEDPGRFIENDEIVIKEDEVANLLDVLDQRHYRGGYDKLLRRADRNSVIA